ncbi:MAG TPA: methyltransferase domain-containing protein [Candidatus Pacearchaeota archaeon]|nr:methyltransferase domain-containing protein [Candidatus Pacearchaeota archaeon]
MSLGNLKDGKADNDFNSMDSVDLKLIRLDLGCGNNKKEGFIGVDVSNKTNADITHDLNFYPYPFKDNSVSEIYCSHFIEHVGNIVRFMEECYRILTDKGIFHILAPYYSSIRAWQDPTHVREISESTFLYFNKHWININGLNHYNINCDFGIQNIKYIYSSEWDTRSEEAKEWARQHYINVVLDINVILKCVK